MKQKLKILIYMLLFISNMLAQENSSFDFSESHSSKDICCECPYDNRELRPSDQCNKCCSYTGYCCGSTIFIPRSQGANTARELVGWQKYLYKPFLFQNYLAFMSTFEYSQSFKPEKLAQRLFCTDCLTFSGSQAPRDQTKDVVADYFGLPVDYYATISIKPKIQNYILDFNFYLGTGDMIYSGLYFRMHIPITYTRWSLGLDECLPCCKFRGHDEFPDCYMYSTTPVETYENYETACHLNVTTDIIAKNDNCATHSIDEALSGHFLFGDMNERWKYGKFSFCPLSKAGVADLDLILGYNFWQSDFGHFALFIQTVVPTGNRPHAKHIFEPIIGNGKHWELGGGAAGHISMCTDYYNYLFNLSFYFEGNVTHVFKNEQIRSFDFCQNGLLSRYILLKEFDADCNYIGRMINAINYNTRNCDVYVGYKVDASAKIVLEFCSWAFDVGYNIYAKSGEKVCIKTECPCAIDLRIFGIKGTEGVCCTQYIVSDGEISPTGESTKLNTTQPDATMFTAILPTAQTLSPTQSTVCLAYNNNTITSASPVECQNFYIAQNDIPPRIISCKDLDPNSAVQRRMLTHKFFSYFGRTWIKYCYETFFGMGSEIEFDGTNNRSSLNQWGIWLKGGINF